LQGIFATGMFWWKVNYDGQAGWVPEASLVTQPQALAVFQMPTFPVVFP
jgi:hypothetical protein